MDMNEVIDRAIKRANLRTDYELSKATGIPQNILSAIRKGKRNPSTTETTQLATLAGLDEITIIGELEMRTAKTEKKREFWRQFLEARAHLGKQSTAAILGICALGLTAAITPEPADANEILQLQNYDAVSPSFLQQKYTLCAQKVWPGKGWL